MEASKIDLSQSQRLRVQHLLQIFLISRPTLYRGIENGNYPKPDGRDGRPYWFSETIRPLVEKKP